MFLLWEVGSCSNTMPKLECLLSVYAARMAGREDATRVYYDPTSGSNGSPAGGKRHLIREEGLASRVSSHVRPRDPGGGTPGTVPTVSPRQMTIDDVSHTMELSGGGGEGGRGGGSAGHLQGFDSVDRGDHSWGHSWTGVSS